MRAVVESSDSDFLSHLHRIGPKTVHEICEAVGVTATAVRQRLVRLQACGMIARDRIRHGRGRPHYVYRVTDKGMRHLGDNYGDLALILWRELLAIEDVAIRDQISQRVRDALVARLGRHGEGTLKERLRRLTESLAVRGFDVEIDQARGLPILRENNCPYQELAEEDRTICLLEREVFEKSLGVEVRLAQCCLDGHRCCEFEVVEGDLAVAS